LNKQLQCLWIKAFLSLILTLSSFHDICLSSNGASQKTIILEFRNTNGSLYINLSISDLDYDTKESDFSKSISIKYRIEWYITRFILYSVIEANSMKSENSTQYLWNYVVLTDCFSFFPISWLTAETWLNWKDRLIIIEVGIEVNFGENEWFSCPFHAQLSQYIVSWMMSFLEHAFAGIRLYESNFGQFISILLFCYDLSSQSSLFFLANHICCSDHKHCYYKTRRCNFEMNY
jgi:hypothetical protein